MNFSIGFVEKKKDWGKRGELMVWHNILYSICVGALISGVILTILLLILAASSMIQGNDSEIDESELEEAGDQDIGEGEGEVDDSGIDDGIDDGLDESGMDDGIDDGIDEGSMDDGVDDGLEPDVDSETDAKADHSDDLGVDQSQPGPISISAARGGHSDLLIFNNRTPISLVFSLYLLSLGATGTSSYDLMGNKILWAGLIIVVPFLVTKLLSKVWQKIAKNTTYQVRRGDQLLGRLARVKIDVSNDGGVISVQNSDSVQQVPARPLYPLAWFYPGDMVYICKFQDGVYLVDSNPKNVEFPKTTVKKSAMNSKLKHPRSSKSAVQP